MTEKTDTGGLQAPSTLGLSSPIGIVLWIRKRLNLLQATVPVPVHRDMAAKVIVG